MEREEVHGIAVLPLPKALGWQGAGTIEKVGEDVDAFGVGDAVLAGTASASRS